jgi:hypothetical protein
MRFEIQPIDHETLDSIYTPKIAEQLKNLIYPTQNWCDSSRRRWVVSRVQNAYFFEVSLADRLDWAFSYVFIQNGEFALIRTAGDCLYAFVTVSAGMATRLERVKCQIAEALRVGGVFLDGKYDLPSEFGVNLPGPATSVYEIDGVPCPRPSSQQEVDGSTPRPTVAMQSELRRWLTTPRKQSR